MNRPQLEYAKKYLDSEDAEAYNVLLRSGATAILPLMQALVEALKGLRDMSMSRSDMESFYDELIKARLITSEEFKIDLRRQIEEIPDGEMPTISNSQIFHSNLIIKRAKNIIDRIGDSAQEALIQIVLTGNKSARCAAAIVIASEKPINQSIAKRLSKTTTFLVNLENEPASFLLVAALAIAGDGFSRKIVQTLCKNADCTAEDLYNDVSTHSIYFVIHS